VAFAYSYNRYDNLAYQGVKSLFYHQQADRTHSQTTQNNEWFNVIPRYLPIGGYYGKEDSGANFIRGIYHSVTQAEMDDLVAWAMENNYELCSISQLAPTCERLARNQWSMLPSKTNWAFGGVTTPISESSDLGFFHRTDTVKYSGSATDTYIEYPERIFDINRDEYYKFSVSMNCTTYNSGSIEVYFYFFDINGNNLEFVSNVLLDSSTNGWEEKQTVFEIPACPDAVKMRIRIHFGVNNFDGTVYLSNGRLQAGVEQGVEEGSATLSSGTTSVTVSHNLPITPREKDITITPVSSLGSANHYWISSVTSTDFTISVDADPTQDVNFYWTIDCGWIPYNRGI